jgi:hypothetical protein
MLKRAKSDKSFSSKLHLSESATSFTDGFWIAKREDKCILLRLVSSLPSQLVENHRTIMVMDDAKKLVDGLCSALDYYPKKK